MEVEILQFYILPAVCGSNVRQCICIIDHCKVLQFDYDELRARGDLSK